MLCQSRGTKRGQMRELSYQKKRGRSERHVPTRALSSCVTRGWPYVEVEDTCAIYISSSTTSHQPRTAWLRRCAEHSLSCCSFSLPFSLANYQHLPSHSPFPTGRTAVSLITSTTRPLSSTTPPNSSRISSKTVYSSTSTPHPPIFPIQNLRRYPSLRGHSNVLRPMSLHVSSPGYKVFKTSLLATKPAPCARCSCSSTRRWR